METASLYIQKVGVVHPASISHMIVSKVRKAPDAKRRGKDIN